MGFYYFNVLSLIPLAVAYGILGLVLYGIARASDGKRWRKAVLFVLGACFAVLPIAEELWIAWSFGQACKTAGTFVYKKVQVDGFYDDTRTTHAGIPTTQAVKSFNALGYQFLEMKGREKFVRLEKIDGQWIATVLQHPTAKYHFKQTYDLQLIGHKLKKDEQIVLDTETGETLAKETVYTRQPNWFFIHLDRPVMFCPTARERPQDPRRMLFESVLLPSKLK